MDWKLSEPAKGVELFAEADGVIFRSSVVAIQNAASLRSLQPLNRLGRLLPSLLPQLLELEVATFEAAGLKIPYEDYVVLEERGIDAFDALVPWAPFIVEIGCSGWLRDERFKYFTRFYLGSQIVNLDRKGCFVSRNNTIYRVDKNTFLLLEAIDKFNALDSEGKTSTDSLIRFAQIKGLAEEVSAELDQYIRQERILIPSTLGVDLLTDDAGRITFAPKIGELPGDAFKDSFLSSDDVDDVYTCFSPDGERVRIVLSEEQRAALLRMQRVRHLSGADRVDVLRDPAAPFDGLAGSVDIDLSAFGPRVKGIGDFPFVAQPYLQRSAIGIFDGVETEGKGAVGRFSAGLKCTYANGTVEHVEFTSRDQLLNLQSEARTSLRTGVGQVQFNGKSIRVDEQFVRALDDLVNRTLRTPAVDVEPKQEKRKFVLIYTNEDLVEYREEYSGSGGESDLELPASLISPGELKAHQRSGVAWLQRTFRLGHHGCLLADDMGLGKTLQILTFLAWVIEGGNLSSTGADPTRPPWKPILIVAPVILLENDVWLNDMRRFFANDGAVFRPWVTLHGQGLRAMRRPNAHGQETFTCEPALDLERLSEFRVVLTNYETVVNYQHSFARMKDRWSIAVTDEAQEYKTPSTKISHALKSLAPRFRIAATGTPVETRLLDVWNIFDFLQPGSLLGSSSDFSKTYENAASESPSDSHGKPLRQLRETLRFGKPDTFVMRREKSMLEGLPTKHEHKIRCHLSNEQRVWHLDLVNRAHVGGDSNHPLALIQQLMRLYQHPGLVPAYEPTSVELAVQRSPKLQSLLECLDDIRRNGEKVLIFTRTLDMQQLLATVIQGHFGLPVDIVNGATSRKNSTQTVRGTRHAILQRFRASQGFNVLILSPDVAGMGLTLVEANHVIHYGRWWNPAKESQATDRAYRIGQTKSVHVYYFLAVDPKGEFETFDEKLDALITRRNDLAADFLAPMPAEAEMERDLLSNILATDSANLPDASQVLKDLKGLTWDRFEAWVGLIRQRAGCTVILTPKCGDDGVDVIAISASSIELIQCKHTRWDAAIDVDTIAETIQALDGYRTRRLRTNAGKLPIRPVLFTNGKLTASAKEAAKQYEVSHFGPYECELFLHQSPCSPAEIEFMQAQRSATMRDVQAKLEVVLRSM